MLYEKFDYILAIAEEQNLTRAAQKLYISQPTLTMYLNRLEESLGVRLFDRKKNPVTLTAAGKYYVEKMQEIVDAEQILKGELYSIRDPDQLFRIGIARVRGHYWLPPLLRSLTERHPRLNIVVSLASEKQLQRQLEKRTLDLAIGTLAAIGKSEVPLIMEELAYEKILMVAHRKFGIVPEKERGNNSPVNPWVADPSSLQNLPYITPPPTSGMYQMVQKLQGQYNIRPSRNIVVDMQNTGLLMAEEGLGVKLISADVLAAIPTEERRRRLDFFVLPDMPEARVCSAAWREDTQALPLIRESIAILKEEILPLQLYTEVAAETTGEDL